MMSSDIMNYLSYGLINYCPDWVHQSFHKVAVTNYSYYIISTPQ